MNTQQPQPKAGIEEIAAYVPGKSAAPEGVKLHKLSANENPLGASPAAIDAVRDAAANMEDYPDGNALALRKAIADVHGLNVDRLVCGAGSDEILSLLAYTYLAPGDEAIYTEHGFLMYRIAILAAGGTPVVAKEENCTAKVDEILSCVTDKTRMVFLANPNNPTGTYIPIEEVRRLHAGLPGNVILVLDAAYAEYVRRNDYEAGVELVSSNANVIMTRTFSKIHGLAALRVGWAYGPEGIIDTLNKVRGPFNVNSAAIAAGAAAIRDFSHVEKAVAHNDEWLERVTVQLEELGLEVTPSVGNFLLIHFPTEAGKTAAEADAFLTQRGFILRAVAGYGFPDALRMSIGSADANEGTMKALKEFLNA